MISKQLSAKLSEFQTPFYLYDISLLRQTLQSAATIADKYGYVLHYAIKANYDKKILSIIKENDLGIDCASIGELRHALYGAYYNIENITSQSDRKERYTIAGTACESTDIFDEGITLPETVRGDFLTIKTAGAYGMSMASRCNMHELPGAVYSDEIA